MFGGDDVIKTGAEANSGRTSTVRGRKEKGGDWMVVCSGIVG